MGSSRDKQTSEDGRVKESSAQSTKSFATTHMGGEAPEKQLCTERYMSNEYVLYATEMHRELQHRLDKTYQLDLQERDITF